MSSTAALLEQIGTTIHGSGATEAAPVKQGSMWRAEWSVNTFLVCRPEDFDLAVHEIAEADFIGLNYHGYVAVQVWKSNHRDFPAYRFTLGSILDDGRFVPNVSPRVNGQRTSLPAIDYTVWNAAVALLHVAQRWQETDVAVTQDRFEGRRQDREVKAPSYQQPRGLGGQKSGKTDRQRAKGKAKPKRD